MNIDSNLFSLAILGILVSTIAGAVIGLHVKNRVPGLGFRDSVRAVVYLTQYDAALEYHGLRRRELRARVDAFGSVATGPDGKNRGARRPAPGAQDRSTQQRLVGHPSA